MVDRADAHAGVLPSLTDVPRDAANPKLIAKCHEGLGEMEAAAAEYLRAGSPRDALCCYRSIPDFDKSLEVVDSLGRSFWQILETSLGVSRKKPTRKPAASRKPTRKKS